jgi:hypothetical protein
MTILLQTITKLTLYSRFIFSIEVANAMWGLTHILDKFLKEMFYPIPFLKRLVAILNNCDFAVGYLIKLSGENSSVEVRTTRSAESVSSRNSV